jgi:UDP-N-acetylmuramate dehydrogenase
MTFQENFDLSKLNTFGIKSSAAYFAEFQSIEELGQHLNQIPKEPLMILGGGSNILLTQAFDGTVLQNKISGIEISEETETRMAHASGSCSICASMSAAI